MKTNLAHKTRIHLNNQQAAFMWGCIGAARFAFNWGRNKWEEMYKAFKEDETLPRPSALGIKKLFNKEKKEKNDWLYNYPACITAEAIIGDLDFAFKNFFRGLKQGQRVGYPKPRKRSSTSGSCCFTNITITQAHIKGNRITLPKEMGLATIGDPIKFNGKLMSTTISHQAGKWYISFQIEVEDLTLPAAKEESIGIDRGVAILSALSNGEKYYHYPQLDSAQKKLKRLQKQLSRKEEFRKKEKRKASNRYKALKIEIAKQHAYIANLRKKRINELTAMLSRRFNHVVIEDLKVKNMTRSAKGNAEEHGKNVKQKSGLNRAILNQAWGELDRQLHYKTFWRGGEVEKIAPAYTSQTCPACGHVSKENRKKQDKFVCVECGFSENADHTAAINIKGKSKKAVKNMEEPFKKEIPKKIFAKSDQQALF